MDNSQRLAEALSQIEPAWDEARTERAWRGYGRKRRRRALVRVAAGTAAIALVVAGSYQLLRDRSASAPAQTELAKTSPELAPEDLDKLVLHDGFTVTPETHAKIDVAHPSAAVIAVKVTSGKSRFQLTKSSPNKKVELSAGALRVTVYASEFSVARYHDVSEVWSHQGETQVVWQGETLIIGEGEHRRFPPKADRDGADKVSDPRSDEATDEGDKSPAPSPDRPAKSRADWRPLAREGKFDAAYRVLRKTGYGKRVADLMLAADVYRMSGHAAKAIKPLQRMVDAHADDPRAPLAAFTLARILLDDLGRPKSAARAFARARAFAPSGPMAEDALAREAEAWAKAGQAARARERAALYLQRYPRGHRVRAVKQYGGL